MLCAAHLPVKRDRRDEIPVFLSEIRNQEICFISRLTGKCATHKLQNFCSSSPLTCLHHMVILRSQNKIIDFLII